MKGKCSRCGRWLQFQRSEAHHVTRCPNCRRHTKLVSSEATTAQKLKPLIGLLTIGMLLGLTLGGLRHVRFDIAQVQPFLTDRVILAAIMVLAFIYFLPSIVGLHKRNGTAIFILDLFFGWTVVGWIAALAWALVEDRRHTAYGEH